MRAKKVWRYWCDHCGKGMCNKGAMRTHEHHCTANPERACRMCARMRLTTKPPRETLLRLKDATLDGLREAVGGCPACMLAVVRMTHVAGWDPNDPEDRTPLDGFDFKAESERFWSEYQRTAWSYEDGQ